MASTLDRLAHDVGHILQFVGAIASADEGPKQLLNSLGWDLPPGVNDVGLAAVDFSSLAQTIDRLEAALASDAGADEIAQRFAELLVELEHAFSHLRAVI